MHKIAGVPGYFKVKGIKKKDFKVSGNWIIRVNRERESKKMWMSDQECRTGVCGGRGATTMVHLIYNSLPLMRSHKKRPLVE